VTVASAFSAGVAVKQGILMRSHGDLTGLIKFLARDDWKSSFEEVLGEHFGPAMQAFDLEYEAIGAALGGSWDMTLWGVAFEDFLGRQFEPDGRNFVDEYLRRRGWNESAPTKAYMRGLRNSIMSLYEASAIVPAQSFLARDLLRGGAPVLISERTATRTLKEWDRIAARIVVQGQKRILAGGVLAFTFEGSEQLMANPPRGRRPIAELRPVGAVRQEAVDRRRYAPRDGAAVHLDLVVRRAAKGARAFPSDPSQQ
jgi:hypothetical protein